MLSQLMYWFSKKIRIYKTDSELRMELNFSEREMKTAKASIKKLSFIKVTLGGVPSRTFYTIYREEYEKVLLSSLDETVHEVEGFSSSLDETVLDETVLPSLDETVLSSSDETVQASLDETVQTKTENTQKTTQKNTTESSCVKQHTSSSEVDEPPKKEVTSYSTSFKGSAETAQERYRKDIASQGPLNQSALRRRTFEVEMELHMKFGLSTACITAGDRSRWIKYLGLNYVAIPIKDEMSKANKTKVIFTIRELRENLYVHLHGHEWNKSHKQHYIDSNAEVSDMKSLSFEGIIEEAEVIAGPLGTLSDSTSKVWRQ